MSTEALLQQRQTVHGSPDYNLATQHKLKQVWRTALADERCSVRVGEAHDEAMEMVLFKIGRIATAKTIHLDNYDDLIGYATLARQLAVQKQENDIGTIF